jgi:hypothetical protein
VIYSIGHSTRQPEEFNELLRAHGATHLVDIRSHPTSKWEWFWKDTMPDWLEAPYIWEPRLGGWTEAHVDAVDQLAIPVDISPYVKGQFPKQHIAQTQENEPDKPRWTSIGLWDYQYFTVLPEFHQGCLELPDGAAIMCAEALWWKCHRSMVADYLWQVCGIDVQHIMSPKQLTAHSRALGNRLERYELDVQEIWHQRQVHPPVAE